MMSEPLRKVLALLACLSIFISPAYGDTSRDQKLVEIEEERLRALLAENRKATEKKKPTSYAGN